MKDEKREGFPWTALQSSIIRSCSTCLQSCAGRKLRRPVFRRLLREISTLLCYEVTRDLELTMETIETPLTEMQAPVLEGKKLVFASICGPETACWKACWKLVPSARVSHVGVYRDHDTLQAWNITSRPRKSLDERLVIVVDPMLATGNSSIAAVDKLKERGARNLRFLCLLAAPEGVKYFVEAHPDVPVYTASLDSHLNERAISCLARRCR